MFYIRHLRYYDSEGCWKQVCSEGSHKIEIVDEPGLASPVHGIACSVDAAPAKGYRRDRRFQLQYAPKS